MIRTSGVAASLAAITLAFSGCAKNPEKVSAAYVPQVQYSNYTCEQIDVEYARIGARVMEVSGQQKDARTRDSVATGVGIVLFWPALFFLAAGDHEQELARLKGEYEALEHAAIEKDCPAADRMRETQQARAKLKAEQDAEEKRRQDELKRRYG